MCGLCWFVQIVHYPLFKNINASDFPAYQKKNYATGFITVPIMIIELGTCIWLLYINQNELFLANAILLAIIWWSTFVFQIPIHQQLLKTPIHQLMNKLIRTNWIRTLSWTVRSILLAYLLL